jgi:hypothetical protein
MQTRLHLSNDLILYFDLRSQGNVIILCLR